MNKNKKLFISTISVILTGVLCLQEISMAGMTPDAIGSIPRPSLSQNPTRFEVPLDFSSLQEIHKGDKDTFIIHIQDAHSNLSGQRNLASTLDSILSKYNISLVLIEGGSKEATLDPLKELAPSKEVLKRVAKSFLIQGNLAGEEYLNLTSDHPMRIMGIEDQDLYLKSVKNYALLADQREKALLYLARIQIALDKLKAKTYPQDMLSYEKLSHNRSDRFESGLKELLALAKTHGIPLDDLSNLRTLSSLEEKEKNIDFSAVNLEQTALIDEITRGGDRDNLQEELRALSQAKNQRVSQFSFLQKILDKAQEKNIALSGYAQLVQYGEYLKIFSDLDLDSVLEESTKAENRVYEKLLQSRDSRLIRSIDRYMKLLDTAFHIRMTTGEFKLFQANERDFLTIPCLAFMNERLASFEYFEDLIPHEDTLEEAKSTLSDFYDSVDKRDMSFIQNTQRIMKEQNQKTAVLISGGYHTEHLKKLFREQGYSYAVVTPIVTSETNQKHYEDLLLSSVRKEVKRVEVVQGEKKSQTKALSAFEREIAQIQKSDGVKAPPLVADGARLTAFAEALGIQGSRLSAAIEKIAQRQENGTTDGARMAEKKTVEGGGSTEELLVGARLADSGGSMGGIFLEGRFKDLPLDRLQLVEIQHVVGREPQHAWIPKILYHGTSDTDIKAEDLKPGKDGVIWFGTKPDVLAVLSRARGGGQVLEVNIRIGKVFVANLTGELDAETTQGMRRAGFDAYYDPSKGHIAYIPPLDRELSDKANVGGSAGNVQQGDQTNPYQSPLAMPIPENLFSQFLIWLFTPTNPFFLKREISRAGVGVLIADTLIYSALVGFGIRSWGMSDILLFLVQIPALTSLLLGGRFIGYVLSQRKTGQVAQKSSEGPNGARMAEKPLDDNGGAKENALLSTGWLSWIGRGLLSVARSVIGTLFNFVTWRAWAVRTGQREDSVKEGGGGVNFVFSRRGLLKLLPLFRGNLPTVLFSSDSAVTPTQTSLDATQLAQFMNDNIGKIISQLMGSIEEDTSSQARLIYARIEESRAKSGNVVRRRQVLEEISSFDAAKRSMNGSDIINLFPGGNKNPDLREIIKGLAPDDDIVDMSEFWDEMRYLLAEGQLIAHFFGSIADSHALLASIDSETNPFIQGKLVIVLRRLLLEAEVDAKKGIGSNQLGQLGSNVNHAALRDILVGALNGRIARSRQHIGLAYKLWRHAHEWERGVHHRGSDAEHDGTKGKGQSSLGADEIDTHDLDRWWDDGGAFGSAGARMAGEGARVFPLKLSNQNPRIDSSTARAYIFMGDITLDISVDGVILTIKNVTTGKFKIYDLTRATEGVVIGRQKNGSDSFVVENNHAVSRQHAMIKMSSEGIFLTDTRSTNGTFLSTVNQRQLATRVEGEYLFASNPFANLSQEAQDNMISLPKSFLEATEGQMVSFRETDLLDPLYEIGRPAEIYVDALGEIQFSDDGNDYFSRPPVYLKRNNLGLFRLVQENGEEVLDSSDYSDDFFLALTAYNMKILDEAFARYRVSGIISDQTFGYRVDGTFVETVDVHVEGYDDDKFHAILAAWKFERKDRQEKKKTLEEKYPLARSLAVHHNVLSSLLKAHTFDEVKASKLVGKVRKVLKDFFEGLDTVEREIVAEQLKKHITLEAQKHNVTFDLRSFDERKDRESSEWADLSLKAYFYLSGIVQTDKNTDLLKKTRAPLTIGMTRLEAHSLLDGHRPAGVADIGQSDGMIGLDPSAINIDVGFHALVQARTTVAHEIIHKLATQMNQSVDDLVFPLEDWRELLKSQHFTDIKPSDELGDLQSAVIRIKDYLSLNKKIAKLQELIRRMRGRNFRGLQGYRIPEPGRNIDPDYLNNPHEIVTYMATEGIQAGFGIEPEKIVEILQRHLLRSLKGDQIYSFDPNLGIWTAQDVGICGSRLSGKEGVERFSETAGARLSQREVGIKDLPKLETSEPFVEILAQIYSHLKASRGNLYPILVSGTSLNSKVEFLEDPMTKIPYALIFGRLEEGVSDQSFEAIGKIDLTEALERAIVPTPSEKIDTDKVFTEKISPVTDAVANLLRDIRLAERKLPEIANQIDRTQPITLTQPVLIIKTFSQEEWKALPPEFKEVMKIVAQKVQSKFATGQVMYQIEIEGEDGILTPNGEVFDVIAIKDISEGTKIMRQGHLSDNLLRSMGEENINVSDVNPKKGAIITQSRIAQDGQINLFNDFPMDILAIMYGSPESFDVDRVKEFAARFTGVGVTGANFNLWSAVPPNATFRMYEENKLVVLPFGMLSLQQVIQVAQMAKQTILSSA